MNELAVRGGNALAVSDSTKEFIPAGVSTRFAGTGQVDKPREEQFPIN